MRTTINIPDNLFQEARKLVNGESPTKTVITVFKEFLKQRKIRSLINKAGRVSLDLDQDKLSKLRRNR